jgi:hypothetical protein
VVSLAKLHLSRMNQNIGLQIMPAATCECHTTYMFTPHSPVLENSCRSVEIYGFARQMNDGLVKVPCVVFGHRVWLPPEVNAIWHTKKDLS